MTGGFQPDPAELLFLPLGGSDEIGMNLNLYHYAGKWLMVDLGVAFGDDSTPGVEVLMPDPSFIAERRRDLAGLVLTHGHEDHIGALPWLWERLRCPVYATPFTASLARRKLAEAGLAGEVELVETPLPGRFALGPFEVETIGMTHSIPEPSAIAIRCAAGTVLHTGDWKFDPDPRIGPVADREALEALAADGVLAMVGDSTNADIPGETGSEAELLDAFAELFEERDGRVAVACFASNVARLHGVARAAERAGRDTALVGRSLRRMNDAARENGYLLDIPRFLTEDDAGYIPRDRLAMICTGSQGEPRAALARIADDTHPRVSLEAGDTVVFSSREIPGNEKAIGRMQSKFAARGVEVVTEREAHVHVSGHPARGDLERMYQTIRPRIAVPVHGDARRLAAHAEVARACQVPEIAIPENGAVLRLAPGPAGVVARVPAGALAVDGSRLRPLDGGPVRERRKLLHNGSVAVTVVMDGRGRGLGDPMVTATGLYDRDEAETFDALLSDCVREAVGGLPPGRRRSDGAVAEAARRAVRGAARAEFGKRPEVSVHVARV